MSLKLGPANGGEELFIIGKNFLRGTKVFFQELSEENGEVKWEKESEIDRDYFQPVSVLSLSHMSLALEKTCAVLMNSDNIYCMKCKTSAEELFSPKGKSKSEFPHFTLLINVILSYFVICVHLIELFDGHMLLGVMDHVY